MEVLEMEGSLDILRDLPVSINNIIGDPFIADQTENTFSKLESLRDSGHRGPISIITKSKLGVSELSRLSDYLGFGNLIIFYTLTGMNEGGISFEERVGVYEKLVKTVPNLVLLFRPVIKGHNDSKEMINSIVKVCSDTNTRLVYTGFYNEKKEKILDKDTEREIVNCADEKDVKVFSKSACATSDISGDVCFAHVNRLEPFNLDFVKQFYDLEVNNEQIILMDGTPGDCNFVRFVTRKKTVLRDGDLHHFLSLGTDIPLLCSSSWFSWSDIVPCSMGCWYCSAEYVFPECKEPKQIGCNPVEIFDYNFAIPIVN
jgi:hypothetical protein